MFSGNGRERRDVCQEWLKTRKDELEAKSHERYVKSGKVEHEENTRAKLGDFIP